MTNVLIHLPAYGRNVRVELAGSIAETACEFQRRGIERHIMWTDITGIPKARNFAASYMLSQPRFTHLLQADADMSFSASAPVRMLEADKAVIACISRGRDPSRGFNFFGPLDPIDRPIFRVKRIGTGISLIKRETLQALVDTGRLRTHVNPRGPNGSFRIYGFFDEAIADDGEDISDDFAFCDRWRNLCGGEVHALADEPVGHVNGSDMAISNFLQEQAGASGQGNASRR